MKKLLSFSQSKSCIDRKPNKKEWFEFTMDIEIKTDDIYAIVKALEGGYSISLTTFKENSKGKPWRGGKYFDEAHGIFLDIDNENEGVKHVSPEEVIEELQNEGWNVNLWYPTFRDTEYHRKFRVGIIFSKPIKEYSTMNFLCRYMKQTFAFVDKKSCEPTRICFGTNKSVTVLNPEPMDMLLVQQLVIENHSNRATNEAAVASRRYKATRKFDISGVDAIKFSNKKYPTYEIIRVRGGEGERFLKIVDSLKRETSYTEHIIEGKAHHRQVIGWVQFFLRMKGGLGYLNDRMIEAGFDDRYIKCVNSTYVYPDLTFNYFDPVAVANGHTDMTRFLLPSNWKSTKTVTLHPVSPIRAKLKTELSDFIKKGSSSPVVLNASTGLGKTTYIRELARDENVAIHFVTHDLKDEFSCGIDYDASVQPLPITKLNEVDSDVKEEYEFLVGTDNQEEARELLQRVVDTRGNGWQQIKEWQHMHVKLRSEDSKVPCLTTHDLYSRSSEPLPKERTIIDESPLNAQLRTDKVSVETVWQFIHACSGVSGVEMNVLIDSVSSLMNASDNTVIEPKNTFFEHIRQDITLHQGVKHLRDYHKVLQLLKSPRAVQVSADGKKYYYYVIDRRVKNRKNTICISATINPTIAKLLFGKDVVYKELPKPQLRAEILQCTEWSCSKLSLNNTHSRRKILAFKDSYAQDATVLTYKKEKSQFEEEVPQHMGNTLGYNTLTGQDIIVVGQLNLPKEHLWLIASLLDTSLIGESIAESKNLHKFYWNDFEIQSVHSYEHPVVRDLHLSLAQSEVLQAIGRARPIDNDARIIVFGKLPIPFVTETFSKLKQLESFLSKEKAA